jgi:hypothetical protein
MLVTIALLKPLNSKIVIELLYLMLPDFERGMIFPEGSQPSPLYLNVRQQRVDEDEYGGLMGLY